MLWVAIPCSMGWMSVQTAVALLWTPTSFQYEQMGGWKTRAATLIIATSPLSGTISDTPLNGTRSPELFLLLEKGTFPKKPVPVDGSPREWAPGTLCLHDELLFSRCRKLVTNSVMRLISAAPGCRKGCFSTAHLSFRIGAE